MKIIVLGGAGEMGKRTVEDLSTSKEISRITVADINKKEADKLVKKISGPAEVDAIRLDAFRQEQVIEAIREYDVVVSALGPYYIFEERMVKAAIAAGVDYISICDEWDVVEKMIDEYDAPAREKNVRIICGMGASPGITNMVAMQLAAQLDNVKKIDISVWLPLDTGAGAAAIQHGVYIMTGDMAVWRNSQKQLLQPCTESEVKEFPNIGKQKVWNMGHSEPVTLPRAIEELEEVNFYMGFGTGSFLLTGPAQLGWYKIPWLNKTLTNAFINIEKILSAKKPREGVSLVEVWGELNGEEKHLSAFGTATMQDSTALTLSVGTAMLVEGKLLQKVQKEGGVYAPEGIFDAGICLKRLREKGMVVTVP